MTKTMVLAGVLALAGPALAQTPAPPAQPPAGGDQKAGGFATDQTYKTKDGGMYQPPAQRPASPAMDVKTYGRT